jgi:hypothetical protein
MEKRPAEDLTSHIEADFHEAAAGGAEYFIIGFLEFQNKNGAVPSAMTVKIYSTNTKELIFEQSFPAGTGRNMGEEYKIAQDAGRIIVSKIRDI